MEGIVFQRLDIHNVSSPALLATSPRIAEMNMAAISAGNFAPEIFSFDVGTTKLVVLDATYNGGYIGHPMDPHARIGFSAHGTLRRSDFGIAFGVPQPGSTMGVGDAVEIVIEAGFSGPAWAAAGGATHASHGLTR